MAYLSLLIVGQSQWVSYFEFGNEIPSLIGLFQIGHTQAWVRCFTFRLYRSRFLHNHNLTVDHGNHSLESTQGVDKREFQS